MLLFPAPKVNRCTGEKAFLFDIVGFIVALEMFNIYGFKVLEIQIFDSLHQRE
jgi:hypothetical protein